MHKVIKLLGLMGIAWTVALFTGCASYHCVQDEHDHYLSQRDVINGEIEHFHYGKASVPGK